MISSLRNFAKTKFAGLLVFIMIIPFVFWGMGGMFSSGNTNNVAKINNNSISTEDFIDYLNKSGIPEKTIRENLEQNIIEEILSGLVSTTLLDLEIKDFDLTISEVTLLKKIKENKNFRDENGVFQRIKYEKFLLEIIYLLRDLNRDLNYENCKEIFLIILVLVQPPLNFLQQNYLKKKIKNLK